MPVLVIENVPLKIAEVTSLCLNDEVSKESVDACSFLLDS